MKARERRYHRKCKMKRKKARILHHMRIATVCMFKMQEATRKAQQTANHCSDSLEYWIETHLLTTNQTS